MDDARRQTHRRAGGTVLDVPIGWDAVRTMEHRIAANTQQLSAWRDRALATSHDT